jgi:hypothetical protein
MGKEYPIGKDKSQVMSSVEAGTQDGTAGGKGYLDPSGLQRLRVTLRWCTIVAALQTSLDKTRIEDPAIGKKRKCLRRAAFLVIMTAILSFFAATGVLVVERNRKSKVSTGTADDQQTAVPTPSTAISPSTLRPTPQPTHGPTSWTLPKEFMDSLPPYSVEAAETFPNSAQAKALAWLRNDSLAGEYDLRRLYQRYALAVFFYATNGNSWENFTGWLSDANECSWYSFAFEWDYDPSVCEGSRFSILKFNSNGLDGLIPTELELLSDLQTMWLIADEGLSVVIHTELYVSCFEVARLRTSSASHKCFLLQCEAYQSKNLLLGWARGWWDDPDRSVSPSPLCGMKCSPCTTLLNACFNRHFRGLLTSLTHFEFHTDATGVIPSEM